MMRAEGQTNIESTTKYRKNTSLLLQITVCDSCSKHKMGKGQVPCPSNIRVCNQLAFEKGTPIMENTLSHE
jgi:hypothetical protein